MRQGDGVNQKIGRNRIGIHPVQGSLQCCTHVGISGLAEADVTVADLHEAEVSRAIAAPGCAECTRYGYASNKTPYHSGSRPRHALQKAAPIHSVAADTSVIRRTCPLFSCYISLVLAHVC